MPYYIMQKYSTDRRNKSSSLIINEEEYPTQIVVRLRGVATYNTLPPTKPIFKKIVLKEKNLRLNMALVEYIDPAFIAYLMIIRKYVHSSGNLLILSNLAPRLKKILYYNCATFLIDQTR